MQPDQQQRIMGYFIEEAKDHLNTIEQGLLNLQNTIEDPEMVNEVFRAAHSVKGGAAMLGLSSIQHVSHRLEDFFKLLKETPIRIDQKLESLFLRAFDSLQELLGQLQGPFGLTEDSANNILAGVEPSFQELEQHLAQLAAESGGISLPTTTGFGLDTGFTLPADAHVEEALANLFRTDVTLQLREMLRLFRVPDTDSATRQQLQERCNTLGSFGDRYGLRNWINLLNTARQAIADHDNSYRILAPVVIKDIKQAQELVLAGRETEVCPSTQLQELVPDRSVETVVQEDLADLLADLQPLGADSTSDEEFLDLAGLEFEQPIAAAADTSLEGLELLPGDELEFVDSSITPALDIDDLESQHGPEVGIAELNTLADLFEGELPDLGLTWQQEEVIGESDELFETGSQDGDRSESTNDFADLLFEEPAVEAYTADDGTAVDDLDDLFGDADLLVETEDIGQDNSPPAATTSESLLGESELDLTDFDDLLQISQPAQVDLGQDLSDPLSNLMDPSSDLELIDAQLFGEVQPQPPVDSQSEEPLGDLSNLFDELDNGDWVTEEQSAIAPDSNPDIPDPWDMASTDDAVSGPELGSLALEDLDLEQFDTTEVEPSVPPLSSEEIDEPLIQEEHSSEVRPVSASDATPAAIADPWEDFDTTENTSLPLSDLSLDELDTSADLLFEPASSSADVDATTADLDFTTQPNSDDLGDDLLGSGIASENLSLEDFYLEDSSVEPASLNESFQDLFEENQTSSTNDLFEEDLFGEAIQPLSSSGLDEILPQSSDAIASDFTSGTMDDLFGETPESSVLNSEELPLEATEEVALFTDEEFELSGSFEPTGSDVEALFGELALDGAVEQAQSDFEFSTAEVIYTPEEPDETTSSLVDEALLSLSEPLEDETSQLSDQELDELLGGVSDQDLDEMLSGSLNSDNVLVDSFDLASESLPDTSSDEDVFGADLITSEDAVDFQLDFVDFQINDFPITASLEDEFIADPEPLPGEAVTEINDEPLSLNTEDFYPVVSPEPQLESESLDGFEFSEAEFGELDSLLNEPAAPNEIFEDLEGLLDDNQLPETEPELSESASPELSLEHIEENQEQSDEFSALELLVEGGAVGLGAVGAIGLASSLNQAQATNESASEFDDLDDLLKDAEEKMGGSPSVSIGRGSVPQSRRVMRPGRVFSEQTMRVPVKHLDNLSNLVGELVVNRNSLEQDQERLRQSLDNLLYQVQQLSDVGQRMQDLYERSLLESSLLASRQSHHRLSPISSHGQEPIVTEVHESSGKVEYDPLEMDRFTGFHSLSQEMIELIVRVRESSSDIEFIVDETEQVTRMFRQVTTQLQEGLTRSRMVPFAQTADRLPRAVRDISMKVGKQAELVVEGRETLIDKMILEQLYDPMTHLVNNALTHGIEPPEVRRAQGKSPAGRILIRAFHQGNQTIISVSDDGSGIDVERVKAKAIEKGLITAADAQHLSRLDIYDILFHPGFTTKDQADDFSGRGVGMDVVRTSLSEIRGVVNIDSNPGKGTTFTIRLPLTLSISKALCCISDRARIAFPMDGVEDMLDLPKERLQTNAEGQPCIAWRDTILPVRPLSDLLSYNRHLSRGNVYGGNQEDDIISIVVLRSAGNFLALQVDQVLGEQEIVIKQLEGPVPKPIGVAGATVLGDGRIMPIADVLELIDLSMGRLRRDSGGALWDQSGGQEGQEPPVVKTEPMVLIVDDSITVRELLSMTFNKVGYRVEQARDGQEAWEKLRSGLPCDIVFCDIEMPRMDGLELLSRIQKDSHLKQLPIAMLTSRGADRHRQMAASLGASGYFTKPYLEEALLDAAQRMLSGERLLNNEG